MAGLPFPLGVNQSVLAYVQTYLPQLATWGGAWAQQLAGASPPRFLTSGLNRERAG
jgi:hypothetical protein